jgi:hypothetical protein
MKIINKKNSNLRCVAEHHRKENTTMVWPLYKVARGENTKINYGMDTTG